MAAVAQENVQKQLLTISTKVNEISNRKEPVNKAVIAFRATAVKDSGSSSEQRVSKNPGEHLVLLTSCE